MSTVQVRVSPATHQHAQQIAEQMGLPLTKVVEQAIEELRRRLFFDQADAAYAALRNNPSAWQEELNERAEWDGTLMDGLEDE